MMKTRPIATKKNGLINSIFNEVADQLKKINKNEDFVISAEFIPNQQVTVRWKRCSYWIHLRLSDYLADLSDNALRSLRDDILSKIYEGEGYKPTYSADLYANEVASDEYFKHIAKVWLERQDSDAPRSDAYKQAIRRRKSSKVGCTARTKNLSGSALYFSTVGRMFAIHPDLDSDDTPRNVLDVLVEIGTSAVEGGYRPNDSIEFLWIDAIIKAKNRFGLDAYYQAEDWLRQRGFVLL